jgi:hypothetical protein
MSRTTFRIFLVGLGAGVALAWVLEALLVGRGVVSTYLAPLAFIAPLLAAVLRTPKS